MEKQITTEKVSKCLEDKKTHLIVLGVALVIGIFLGMFLNSTHETCSLFSGDDVLKKSAESQMEKLNLGDRVEMTDEESQRVIDLIGKLMILPNEQPLFSVTTDAVELRKQQVFYANVENGDILVIYPESAMALIYRPSTNIIVNVGPLTLTEVDG